MTRKEIKLSQGGERTYITPVSVTYTDYFKVNFATTSFVAMFKAILTLLRVGVFVAYGEEERPYCSGSFDPTLTLNRGTHVGGPLHLIWIALMESLLFLYILFAVRSWREFRCVFTYYRNSTLVLGETHDTGMPVSVYGYMRVPDYASSQLVAACYMDVSDSVIYDDLVQHKEYDFKCEAAAYDHDRGVFMVSANNTVRDLVAWADAHTTEDRFVTYLRNVDT